MKLKKNIAISESGFVFNPGTGESFSVNKMGLEILNLIKNEKTFEEIKEHVIFFYDVDGLSFEKYYLDFEESLKRENFIE